MAAASESIIENGRLKKVLLVGHPNVGKSVVFNLLTGEYVTVSNYPGTTVEFTKGRSRSEKDTVIVDTPGVQSLLVNSQDEQVTIDILLNEDPDVIVQVADAKNILRSLVLTFQLLETGKPIVLVLNMYDEALERGINIDSLKLSKLLGIDVLLTIATEGSGTAHLSQAISKAKSSSRPGLNFPDNVNQALKEASAVLDENRGKDELNHFLAMLLISGYAPGKDFLKKLRLDETTYKRIDKIKAVLDRSLSRPTWYILNQHRQNLAKEFFAQVAKEKKAEKKVLLSALADLAISPKTGFLFAGAVLVFMYLFVGKFGAGTLVDFFENTVFNGYINPFFLKVFSKLPSPFLRDLFIGEYGIVTMALTYVIAIILPIVSTFFIAFGLLEDSGYLPRLSALADRSLRRVGLGGKAVLPLMLGLGCASMATLTTRILDSRKERFIATFLLALAIPCSAQLGVILGMLSSVSFQALTIWLLVVLFTGFVVGAILERLIKDKPSDFILEIPPLRLPSLKNIFVKLAFRLKWYFREAVPLFMLGTFVLFVFDKVGLLDRIKDFFSPVVTGLLGLPQKATEAFLLGFLRRDYGAAGLYDMQRQGLLDMRQIIVSAVVLTLFVPCVAHFFIMIKEQGLKAAIMIFISVIMIAILIGALLNAVLILA